MYCSFFIMPSTFTRFPGPLAEKHPQSIILAPPCLTVGTVLLVLNAISCSGQTKAPPLCPKSSIFVSSNHKADNQKLRSFSKCDFAKARWACACLCSRSGVFLGLHPRKSPPPCATLAGVFALILWFQTHSGCSGEP